MKFEKKQKRLLHIGCNVGTESMPKYFREQCDYTELKPDDRLAINLEKIVDIPEIVFLQIQNSQIGNMDTNTFIGDQIRSLKNRGAFIINWTGDKRNGVPQWMYQFAHNVNITGFSNEEDVSEFNKKIPNGAIFLQQGIDTDIFKPEGEAASVPEIVFLANNYGDQFPLSNFRSAAVKALRSKYGNRFKVYGNGWGTDSGNVNNSQHEEAKVYRGCRIAISISHFNSDRYFSDRLGRALCSGAFVVSHNYRGIEKDFERGEHLVAFDNLEQMPKMIDMFLYDADSSDRIAKAGQELASKEFSYQNIVKQILALKE